MLLLLLLLLLLLWLLDVERAKSERVGCYDVVVSTGCLFFVLAAF